jgi:hypothetical protein
LAAQNFLDPDSVEYVTLSDGPVSLVFYVPITTCSTYNGTHKLVERDNSLPGAPRGVFTPLKWSVVLLSAQIAAEGRLAP